MPTIDRYKGFRFHFYTNEGHEPPRFGNLRLDLPRKLLRLSLLGDGTNSTRNRLDWVRGCVTAQFTAKPMWRYVDQIDARRNRICAPEALVNSMD